MSDSIIINQSHSVSYDKSKFSIKLPSPAFISNKQCALAYLGIYYSWRNITAGMGNNSFQYKFNRTVYDVVIPDGFYTIDDLNNFLQYIMEKNGHCIYDDEGEPAFYISFNANLIYYQVSFTLTRVPTTLPVGFTNPNNISLSGLLPELIFSNSNFNKLLGINIGTYPTTANTPVVGNAYSFNSQNVAQISPVTTVLVSCNLVFNNNNNLNRHIFYQFTPNSTYGSYMTFQVPYLIWYEVSAGNYDNIEMQFSDQDGNPLNLIDTNITATVVLRDK